MKFGAFRAATVFAIPLSLVGLCVDFGSASKDEAVHLATQTCNGGRRLFERVAGGAITVTCVIQSGILFVYASLAMYNGTITTAVRDALALWVVILALACWIVSLVMDSCCPVVSTDHAEQSKPAAMRASYATNGRGSAPAERVLLRAHTWKRSVGTVSGTAGETATSTRLVQERGEGADGSWARVVSIIHALSSPKTLEMEWGLVRWSDVSVWSLVLGFHATSSTLGTDGLRGTFDAESEQMSVWLISLGVLIAGVLVGLVVQFYASRVLVAGLSVFLRARGVSDTARADLLVMMRESVRNMEPYMRRSTLRTAALADTLGTATWVLIGNAFDEDDIRRATNWNWMMWPMVASVPFALLVNMIGFVISLLSMKEKRDLRALNSTTKSVDVR